MTIKITKSILITLFFLTSLVSPAFAQNNDKEEHIDTTIIYMQELFKTNQPILEKLVKQMDYFDQYVMIGLDDENSLYFQWRNAEMRIGNASSFTKINIGSAKYGLLPDSIEYKKDSSLILHFDTTQSITKGKIWMTFSSPTPYHLLHQFIESKKWKVDTLLAVAKNVKRAGCSSISIYHHRTVVISLTSDFMPYSFVYSPNEVEPNKNMIPLSDGFYIRRKGKIYKYRKSGELER